MARLLRMPEVAANAVEAVLSEWPIPENTPFRSADSIATVETEKAVVEVTADADGVILKTLVPAGAMVEVGAPIALLGEPGEHVEDVATLLLELGVGSDVAPATVAPSTATPSGAEGATAGVWQRKQGCPSLTSVEPDQAVGSCDGTLSKQPCPCQGQPQPPPQRSPQDTKTYRTRGCAAPSRLG